jgi:hypothetical protein
MENRQASRKPTFANETRLAKNGQQRSLANIGKLLRNVLGRGALDRPFPAYKGNDPDVFLCYAHDDEDFV